MFAGCPSVRSSVNTYSALRDISVCSDGISVKLGRNIRKGFQGQRSKVKVIIRPIDLHWRMHILIDDVAFRMTCL